MPKKYTDDNILLHHLKQHSEEAYKAFYTGSRVRLYVLAVSILRDEEAAKDLLQEFYTDFWENRLYININVSLKAYLFASIRNRAFTYKKKQQSYARFIESLPQFEWTETPKYFENEELKKDIERAIGHLPPMAAKIFRMHYIENQSHLQIADLLNISKATVANHIHRALTQLRTELKKS